MKKEKMEIVWRDAETHIKIKSVELPNDPEKRQKLLNSYCQQVTEITKTKVKKVKK